MHNGKREVFDFGEINLRLIKATLLKTNGGTLQELRQVERTFHIGHYEAGVFDARNYTNGKVPMIDKETGIISS